MPKKKFPKKETPLQEYPVLLKDSPRTELVCSREYNLQKERLFVIKNHCISAEPNRPTQVCRATRTSGLKFF
jgi:hypothetical protein